MGEVLRFCEGPLPSLFYSLCFSCDIGVVSRGVRVGVVESGLWDGFREGRERPVLLINTGRRPLWVFVMIGRRPGGVMNRSRVARMGRGRHARCLPAWWPWPRWPRAAYAGGAGDNRPGGATGGLPAGMFWQYKDDASGSFGPAANADGSPRIASVEAAYKRAGVSVVNDGVYDGPGAIRDTLRGALSKCVAGFRQRHPGEGDGDCRVVGVGSVAGQQGGRWVYNGSGGYSASEWYSSWDSQIKPGTFQYGSIVYKTSYPFDDDPSNSVDKIAYDNIARADATPNLIIIVLDKYQPAPPSYHLSISRPRRRRRWSRARALMACRTRR